MLEFHFIVPFAIAVFIIIFVISMHVIYRRNAEAMIADIVKNVSEMEGRVHKLRTENQSDYETYTKIHQQLREELVESKQLNEDLQRTLTALRRHKANQRNSRKAQPRNHSQQGQSK